MRIPLGDAHDTQKQLKPIYVSRKGPRQSQAPVHPKGASQGCARSHPRGAQVAPLLRTPGSAYHTKSQALLLRTVHTAGHAFV